MIIIRVIALFISITAITCQDVKLFDSNLISKEEKLTFLQENIDNHENVAVIVEQCLVKPIFQITKILLDPNNVIKGQNIRTKIVGVMQSDQSINRLHLETFFNGSSIFTDNVDKKNIFIKKGTYGYEYETSVPTFTPSGLWEIYLYLINESGNNLSFLKMSFSMP